MSRSSLSSLVGSRRCPANTSRRSPAIPAPVFRDLQMLAERLPADSRMWTWWDFGFAISDTTGFGVYHDGAAQYTPQTNLIAASFVDPDPRVMHDVIGFVDREGNRGIRRLAASAGNFNDLLLRARERFAAAAGSADLRFVHARHAAQIFGHAISRRSDQSATLQRGSVGIRWLPCEQLVDDKVYCAGEIFDLRTGLIERQRGPSGQTAETGKLAPGSDGRRRTQRAPARLRG